MVKAVKQYKMVLKGHTVLMTQNEHGAYTVTLKTDAWNKNVGEVYKVKSNLWKMVDRSGNRLAAQDSMRETVAWAVYDMLVPVDA